MMEYILKLVILWHDCQKNLNRWHNFFLVLNLSNVTIKMRRLTLTFLLFECTNVNNINEIVLLSNLRAFLRKTLRSMPFSENALQFFSLVTTLILSLEVFFDLSVWTNEVWNDKTNWNHSKITSKFLFYDAFKKL